MVETRSGVPTTSSTVIRTCSPVAQWADPVANLPSLILGP
ncbi:Uncharacterised protein [Mycobacteroides abscessus subsp. abscessus]|nr:Uncharacterised protein [Mycobacteroides abscessus subsp. abscessus]SKU68215.1 Uncharacterised protein [Mycobacteroides abscessus subsp. abscessus]